MKENVSLKSALKEMLLEIAEFNYEDLPIAKDVGIFNGVSGLSLFYHQLYKYTSEEKYNEQSLFFFEKAYNNLKLDNFNLSHGATGIMWLMNFLREEGAFSLDFDSYLIPFDEVLYKVIDGYSDDLDPMHGLLSIANYLFLRNSQAAEAGLLKILDAIDRKKISVGEAITWENSKDDIEQGTFKHINFGYAHGILAILYFISKYIQKGIDTQRSLNLFENGIKYFMSFKVAGEKNLFPNRIQHNEVKRNSRIAYCYGDLGIACGLTAIGRNLNDKSLLSFAQTVATNAARRVLLNKNKTQDIGLCHGAAGNGYMFQQLFKKFKSNELKEASEHEFAQLLAVRQVGAGIAGLRALDYDDEKGVLRRKTDPGFIEGTVGVGLSIISFLNSRLKNSWDKILYLS